MGFISANLFAQTIKVGEWRDHLSYRSTYDLCIIDSKIYTITNRSVFVYDKNDNSLSRLNTLNGLSDAAISSIASSDHDIIIGYENGNLDLLNGAKIQNLADIKRSSLIANKRINHINIEDNLAYLSTGFGIVVLDLERTEIKDTYFIGQNGSYINILSTSVAYNTLFAATENGIYKASLNQANLADFQAWQKVSFRPNSTFNLLETYNDFLFANKQGVEYNTDSLYIYDGVDWSVFSHPHSNTSIKVIDSKLCVTSRYGMNVYDLNLNTTHHFSSANFNFSKEYFRAGIFHDNEFWIADKYNGLLHHKQGNSRQILPSGPYVSDVAQIKNFGSEIWLAHGAKDENWDPTWSKSELSILRGDYWSNTNVLYENEFWDPIALNQHNNQIYVASWQKGLAAVNETTQFILYNESNSSLQSRAIHNDWTNVGAIEFDSDGNLWCTNSQTTLPLSVMYTSGDWEAFSLGNTVTEGQNIAKLIIDKNNQKWIQLRNNGIVVFDENRSGEKTKKLSNAESTGNLTSERVYSMIEDLDGEIWIGTDDGVSVFYNPENIFDDENASSIIVTKDGHNTHLLDGLRINDIEVDGANRKWFATNNSGAVLTSENGTEEIYHFTSENSPLFSNKIIDIEVNQISGEVFFATDKGLISYRGGATSGSADFSEVVVYPNPVKPNYEGLISIKGLITNAIVKITDISGNLVYKTTALGGQAVWDGKSLNGEKVHSGVYLIFCSDDDGNINHVSKILIVRD